ncbi:hypothetical protein [Clostridium ganghwense]|uniref:Uncharacterized protein n=1 Tax=Clostridium ganghwense TaxID=312089 RepID=A0ABT4CJP8_9CLOT|nr:hypothetical protein [Clostridium ganghwense]MCY6369280.1 hypothetical protein [Clostridium ganghwense]
MSEKSHIDINKLNKVPKGHPFEYRDVVEENFPMSERVQDGKRFKGEVEKGEYDSVVITEDDGDCVQYKKI